MNYPTNEHHARKRNGWLRGLAALVLLAVLGLVWLSRGRDSAQVADAAVAREVLDSNSNVEPVATEVLPIVESRAEVADESRREDPLLEVVDPDGRAVDRAAVVLTSAEARKFLLHDGTALALTDEVGQARLSAGWIRAHADESLSVVVSGFLPASLPISALEDGFERVTLPLGLEVAVNCLDLDGSPLPDVTVALSLTALPSLTDATVTASTPGPNAENAIYVAVSDAVGRARFRGLSPGHYGMRTWAASHALISGQPRGASLDLPGPEPTLRFGDLVAVVYRVEGEKTLGLRTIMFGSVEFANYAEDALTRERKRLESRFPDCFVLAAALKPDVTPQPFLVRACFANSGIQEFELMPRRIAEIDAPTVLTPTSASVATELAECELVLLDASGNACHLDRFYVELEEPDSILSLTARIDPGKTQRLPPGEYRLRHRDRWVSANLASDAFHVPGVNVVSLRADFRRCRVWILGPDGASCDGAQVTLAADDGERRLVVQGAEPAEIWLPVGTCGVTARDGSGRLEGRLEAQIERSSSGEAQEVLVRLVAGS